MSLHLSLRAKLVLTIVTIGIIVSGVNIYQTLEVRKVDSFTKELIYEDMKRLDVLREARFENARLRPVIEASTQMTISGDATKLQSKIDTYVALSKQNTSHSPNKQLLNELLTSAKGVIEATKAFSANDSQALAELKKNTKLVDSALATLIQHEQTTISNQNVAIHAATDHIKVMFILMTVGVTAAAVMIGLIVMTSIAGSLAKIRAGATRIANGDFSTPVKIDSNDELGQLGISFNSMSERMKDSYRRLAVEQQRDEAILQGMGEGLIATDEKGNVLLINQVGAEYLRVPDITSALGKPVQEIYQLFDANSADNSKPITDKDRPIFAAISTGKQINDVYSFYKQDGTKTLFDVTATPIKLEDKVVGAISILRDVTKEREIDRMKTEFISLASHQLRTPLSAIKWFTEMLISGDAGELTPDQHEFAKNIDESTTRMIALVNALLNISRIESGRIMIDPEPTDLRELVSGIVNDLKAKTEEKKQTLIISVHAELPKINLDPRLIGQVYLNLLTNAVKYTQEGGEISVFISRKDDQIISQVTDNGYGIPKAQQNRVFQKFFRAANAVKVETDGTGLGLYLIKSVVESSGGKIWFESEEGKGTTFWFSIPVSGMQAKEGEVTLDV